MFPAGGQLERGKRCSLPLLHDLTITTKPNLAISDCVVPAYGPFLGEMEKMSSLNNGRKEKEIKEDGKGKKKFTWDIMDLNRKGENTE